MFKVKIFGAGSIGNHLAYACRNKGWEVTVTDVDGSALERMKKDIYPSRYGSWDDQIRLFTADSAPAGGYDLVIIGTPPDTHMKLAFDIAEKDKPKVLLIEKPLCTPSLSGCDKLSQYIDDKNMHILVAYNHTLTKNTIEADTIIGSIGEPLSINVDWLEYWGGIFSAHPWLNGPKDSYLGFFERGGGACGEHSHAINIWQHFSHTLGMGRIVEVSSMMDIVDGGGTCYDRYCSLNVKTEKGLTGNIIMDVITEPSEKTVRIQGDKGYCEWWVNYEPNCDAIRYKTPDKKDEMIRFNKKRPDDFKGEIDHVEDLLNGSVKDSPISLQRGLESALVIAAAHSANKLKKTVSIDYNRGFTPAAIK